MSLDPDEQELSRELESLTAGLRQRFARCPDPSVIQAAMAFVLPDGPGTQIRAHVNACPMCRLLVRDLELLEGAPLPERYANRIWARVVQGTIESGITSKTLSSRPGRAVAKWWTRFFRPWAIAAAAMAVIVLAIGLSVGIKLVRAPRDNSESSNRLPQDSPRENTEGTGPPQSIPSPSTSTTTAFILEKAPVRLPASAAMVWRGGADAESERASAGLKELEQALVPYRAGNYAEAELRLKRLAEKYSRSEARFYLGVSQLFLNKDQEAVGNLKAAQSLADRTLSGQAAWYLAMAYHRVGQNDQARPLLEKLCGATGKDSARACAALRELSKIP